MSQQPGTNPEKIHAVCPQCGKQYAVDAAHVGREARCTGCGEPFVVAAKAPAVAPPAGTIAPPADAGALCGICQSPFGPGEATRDCAACGGRFHADCWDYNHGCGMYGCSEAPPTEGLDSLEIPPSHWGREDKQCPKCGETILASAVRCRHCGATFSSSAPQGSAAYARQQRIKSESSGVRTAGIWLLVFSLIPCTAPLAAVIGLVWYLTNRQVIRSLPAIQSALCRIAVGVAWVQTALLTLFAFLVRIANG